MDKFVKKRKRDVNDADNATATTTVTEEAVQQADDQPQRETVLCGGETGEAEVDPSSTTTAGKHCCDYALYCWGFIFSLRQELHPVFYQRDSIASYAAIPYGNLLTRIA